MPNLDVQVVRDFGREWDRFDQSGMPDDDLHNYFQIYFGLFPWDRLPPHACGFDVGCGSGRWAKLVAPRVGELHCVDAAAQALDVARKKLAGEPNCVFHLAEVGNLPFEPDSMDFGYSLGVLHHVPDTGAGIRHCANALKPGAPLLLYLYYAFDGKPLWFKTLWKMSDLARGVISRLPHWLKHATCDVLAAVVYFPLARAARIAERLGASVEHWPLSAYRHRSFYVMRTDSLDRFGTRLEQRFTRDQIGQMMSAAGLVDIQFEESEPRWRVIGFKDRG